MAAKKSSSSFFLILLSVSIIFMIVFSMQSQSFLFGKRAAGPTIFGLSISDVKTTEVVVNWTSSAPLSSYVKYNTVSTTFSGDPSSWKLYTATDPNYVTSHKIRINGLQPNTTYYFRVGGKPALIPTPGVISIAPWIISSDIVSAKTLSSPRFNTEPSVSYNQQNDGPNNYHASVTWITDVPTVFLTGYNRDSSKLQDSNPTNWVNDWGSKYNWSTSYLQKGQSPTYEPTYGVKYYFRAAAKDPTGKMITSRMLEIYRPPKATPTPSTNCCGYNSKLSQWYCYTGCFYGQGGANPDVTTLSPGKYCQSSLDCQR